MLLPVFACLLCVTYSVLLCFVGSLCSLALSQALSPSSLPKPRLPPDSFGPSPLAPQRAVCDVVTRSCFLCSLSLSLRSSPWIRLLLSRGVTLHVFLAPKRQDTERACVSAATQHNNECGEGEATVESILLLHGSAHHERPPRCWFFVCFGFAHALRSSTQKAKEDVICPSTRCVLPLGSFAAPMRFASSLSACSSTPFEGAIASFRASPPPPFTAFFPHTRLFLISRVELTSLFFSVLPRKRHSPPSARRLPRCHFSFVCLSVCTHSQACTHMGQQSALPPPSFASPLLSAHQSGAHTVRSGNPAAVSCVAASCTFLPILPFFCCFCVVGIFRRDTPWFLLFFLGVLSSLPLLSSPHFALSSRYTRFTCPASRAPPLPPHRPPFPSSFSVRGSLTLSSAFALFLFVSPSSSSPLPPPPPAHPTPKHAHSRF